MKKIFIASLLLLSISGKYSFAAVSPVTCTNTVSSDACNTIEGCGWKATDEAGGGKCTPCDEGWYGAGCTEQCPVSHPTTNGNGAQVKTECVFICPEEEITDDNGNPMGKRTPKQEHIPFINSDETPSCEYTISCYGIAPPDHIHPCTTYHLNQENQTCEPDYKIDSYNNNRPGTGGYGDQCNKYFMVYENNRYTPVSCTECDTGNHLNPTAITDYCGIPTGNKCDADSISCDQLGNPTVGSECEYTENTAEKYYTWDADKQSYNYNDCTKKCKVKEGRNTNEYTFIYDGNKWVKDKPTGNTKCDEGSCLMPGETACEAADYGYYAIKDQNNCEPCPGGTTTVAQGATSKTECVITNATKFCDKTGCFTLPINGTIEYFRKY